RACARRCERDRSRAPGRAQRRSGLWEQDRLAAEPSPDRDRVEPGSTPAGDENGTGRVDALSLGYFLDGADHVLGEDIEGGVGRFLDPDPGRLRDEAVERRRSRVALETKTAAQEALGAEQACNQCAIRDGRPFAAAAVRDGAGLGTRAFRPDVQ